MAELASHRVERGEEQKTFITQGDEAGVAWKQSQQAARQPLSLGAEDAQSLRLQSKLQELRDLDEQYALHGRRYEARMRRVAEGEAAFRSKQAHTVAYLRRFKAFIAETDQKRSRAEKKEQDERKQKEDREGELTALHSTLAAHRRRRDSVKRKNDAYSAYRVYLESALLASDQFSEIDELINRQHILQQTHDDLTAQAQQVNGRLEELQRASQAAMKASQNSVLLSTSEYARLLVSLERLSNRNSSDEALLSSWEAAHTAGMRGATEVSLAIRNIHQRCTRSRLDRQTAQTQPQQLGAGGGGGGGSAVQAHAMQQRRSSSQSAVGQPSAVRRSSVRRSSHSGSAARSGGGSVSTAAAQAGEAALGEDSGGDASEDEAAASRRWREAEAGHQQHIDGVASAWGEHANSKQQRMQRDGHRRHSSASDYASHHSSQAASTQPAVASPSPAAARTSALHRHSLPTAAASTAVAAANGSSGLARRAGRLSGATASPSAAASTNGPLAASTSSAEAASVLSGYLADIAERVGELQFVIGAVHAEARQAAQQAHSDALRQRQQQHQQQQQATHSSHATNVPTGSASSSSHFASLQASSATASPATSSERVEQRSQ